MTRIRWMSVRRGMDQVIDDVVARPAGSPSGGVTKLAVAADEHRHVHWAHECWIGGDLGVDAEALEYCRSELAHRHPFTTADVVRLTHHASFEQRKIRVRNVGDMQKIAYGVSVPDYEG